LLELQTARSLYVGVPEICLLMTSETRAARAASSDHYLGLSATIATFAF